MNKSQMTKQFLPLFLTTKFSADVTLVNSTHQRFHTYIMSVQFRLSNGVFESFDEDVGDEAVVSSSRFRIYFGNTTEYDEHRCTSRQHDTEKPKLFFDETGKLCIIELPLKTYEETVRRGNWGPRMEFGEGHMMIYLTSTQCSQPPSETIEYDYTFMFDYVDNVGFISIEILDAKLNLAHIVE